MEEIYKEYVIYNIKYVLRNKSKLSHINERKNKLRKI
jgi:hypothetical protein